MRTFSQIPYKQFKLKIGAVPSIFPGPKYLSKTLKRRKDPAIRKFDVPSKKLNSIPNNLPNYVDENVDVLEQCSNVNNLFNEIANHDNLSSIIKWSLHYLIAIMMLKSKVITLFHCLLEIHFLLWKKQLKLVILEQLLLEFLVRKLVILLSI